MWYCAHAIFYYRCEDQDSYLLHENVYLIDSKNDDEAFLVAEKVGKENEDLSEDGHLEVNGVKAQYVFAGIRKVIQVELDSETAKGNLFSGVEVTYSVMEVDNLAEINDLASGEEATVLYRE
jgi:hypothetical protein